MKENIASTASISTIHLLSNPISSLERLIYTHSDIINPDDLIPKSGNLIVERLVSQAKERQKDKKFTSTCEIYKDYISMLFQNVAKLKDKQIVFLDFKNYTLESRAGTFKSSGIDDFSADSDFSKYMMLLYTKYNTISKDVSGAMEKLLFWRISPYDFPFMISKNDELNNGELNNDESNNEPFIYHPFANEVEELRKPYIQKGKFSLGGLKRNYSDLSINANYLFSSSIISLTEFREQAKQSQFIETKKFSFEKSHEKISTEEFIKLNETAIRLNREILKKKYSILRSHFSLKPISYMLAGDVGMKMLKDTSIPGVKLLSNIKKIPLRRVLEPQALNKLSGWLSAKYSKGTNAYIFQKEIFENPVLVNESWKNPGILTLGNPKEVDEGIKSLNQEHYKLLQNELKQYTFSISPIEIIILRLNYENFSVQSDEGRIPWQKILNGKKVHPYNILDIKNTAKSIIRPSNSGVVCELAKFISSKPRSMWEGMGNNDYANIGTLIHSISNELESKSQLTQLEKHGINPLKRDRYCEVPISHEFKPSDEIWSKAKENISVLLDKTSNEFYELMLKQLDLEQGNIIFDSGSPDGVAIIEELNELVIIDFKRRMANYNPTQYFFAQLSRYAMAVMQSKEMSAKNFYTAIIQTPFHSSKFAQNASEEFIDAGLFRSQKIRLRKVNVEGDFLKKVQTGMVLEYLGNTILKEDINAGFLVRDLYKNNSFNKLPSCQYCFSNDANSNNYKCRFLMDGIRQVWNK